MNDMDTLVSGDLPRMAADVIPRDQTCFIGPTTVALDEGEATQAIRDVVARIRGAAPKGARVTGWLHHASSGIMGQITIDAQAGAGQIVWTLPRGDVELEYRHQRMVAFPSDSAKLTAAANPLRVIAMVGDGGEETSALLRHLGYTPVIAIPPRGNLSLHRVPLQRG